MQHGIVGALARSHPHHTRKTRKPPVHHAGRSIYSGLVATNRANGWRHMTGRRIVSISLPQFAMERWMRVMERQGDAPPDDIPLVLAREGHHGPVIHAANR